MGNRHPKTLDCLANQCLTAVCTDALGPVDVVSISDDEHPLPTVCLSGDNASIDGGQAGISGVPGLAAHGEWIDWIDPGTR